MREEMKSLGSKLPTLSFTYLSIDQLPVLNEILSENKLGIKSLSERYVLFMHEGEPLHHDCPMFEYLYQDLKSSNKHWVHKYYEGLIKRHGQELVDLLIVKDEEHIRKKIRSVIDLAFDSVYKTEVLRLQFGLPKEKLDDNGISIRVLLMSVINLHYDVIESELSKKPYTFIIKKEKMK